MFAGCARLLMPEIVGRGKAPGLSHALDFESLAVPFLADESRGEGQERHTRQSRVVRQGDVGIVVVKELAARVVRPPGPVYRVAARVDRD